MRVPVAFDAVKKFMAQGVEVDSLAGDDVTPPVIPPEGAGLYLIRETLVAVGLALSLASLPGVVRHFKLKGDFFVAHGVPLFVLAHLCCSGGERSAQCQ